MKIPPGVAYTIQKLPSLLFPPAIVFVAQKVAQYRFYVNLPTWALIAASILSLPLALILNVLYMDFKHSREAAAQGAALPPQVYDPLPGGVTLLLHVLDNFKNGYPGMSYK